MSNRRYIEPRLIRDDEEIISREEAIRKVGEPAFNYFEKAANRENSKRRRIKNFIKGENALGRKVGLVTDIAMFFLPSGVRSGREAVHRILTKEEKRMLVLNDKPWFQSKTIWSAILIVITGILQAAGVDLGANPAAVDTIYQVIYTVTGGFGLYGLRDAVGKKMENSKAQS